MIYHISDSDLDGIGCHIIARHLAKDQHVRIHATPGTVDATINMVLDDCGDKDDAQILITDLSPRNQTTIDRLSESINENKIYSLTLIDHHKTAQERLLEYPWAHIDTTACATMLTFKYFNSLGLIVDHDVAHIERFATIVNDYDLWINQYKESYRLNTLLDALGLDMFYDRFTGDPHLWLHETDTDKMIIEVFSRSKEEYIKQALESAIVFTHKGFTVALVFAEKYPSAIGGAVLDKHKEVDYVEILNMQTRKASLRSRPGGVDVSAIANSLGGGGHAAAAGYYF